MGNVIPKLQKVFRILEILILSMALIFIFVVGAVNLPFVHSFITAKTNTILEKKGIPLHIGKISLLLNGKIGIKEIEIITTGPDTVVYAGSVNVNVKPIPLFSKKVVISTLTLNDAVMNIIASEETGLLNIIEVFSTKNSIQDTIASDTSKKTSSPWEIRVNEVAFNHIRFRYDDKPGGILVEQQLQKAKIEFSNFSLLNKQIDIQYLTLESPVGKVAIRETGQPQTVDDGETAPWKFSAKSLNISDLSFVFEQPDIQQQIAVQLKKGELTLEKLDLATSEILVEKIELIEPAVTFTSGKSPAEDVQPELTAESFTLPVIPWTIKSAVFVINKGSFKYNPADSLQSASLGKWLPVHNLNVAFTNTGLTPAGYNFSLDNLSFALANTLEIDKGSLLFAIDSLQKMKLNLNLNAILKEKQTWLEKKTEIKFTSNIEGNASALEIHELSLQSSGGLNLSVVGKLTEPLKALDAGCELRIVSDMISRNQLLPVIKHLSPQTKLPMFSYFTFSGFIKNKVKQPGFGFKINSPTGVIKSSGNFDINRMSGALQSEFTNVQLAQLFGESLPENLTGNLQVKGQMKKGRLPEGDCLVQIDSIKYKGITTCNISMQAEMLNNEADIKLLSADSALNLDFAAHFTKNKTDNYLAKLEGFFDIDFFALNFMPEPLSLSGNIVSALEYANPSVIASAAIINFAILNKADTATLEKIELSLDLSDSLIISNFDADFLHAHFNSHALLPDFQKAFESTQLKNVINLDSTNFLQLNDIQNLKTFSFEATIHHHPIFHLFYPDSVLNFSDINIELGKTETDSITLGTIKTNWINFNKINFLNPEIVANITPDRLTFGLNIDSIGYQQNVIFGKSQLNLEVLPSFIYGNFNIAGLNDTLLYQVGFRTVRDQNLLIFRSDPTNWIVNKKSCRLSPVEFFTYDLSNNQYAANLGMDFEKTHFSVKGKNTDKIELVLENLVVPNFTNTASVDSVPLCILNIDALYTKTEHHNVEMKVDVHQLKWMYIDFDQLSLTGNMEADSTGILNARIHLAADDSLALNMLMTADNIEKTVEIKSDFRQLHFQLFEPFISEYAQNLHGTTNGQITINRNKDKLNLNGNIEFNDFGLNVVPLKTELDMEHNKIEIVNNNFLFNNFTVTDSLKHPLIIDGKIIFEDQENIRADLVVKTKKLQLMNTQQTATSPLFGSLIVNSSLTVKGSVFTPTVKGNILLDAGTNLTYQMIQDLSVENTQTDVVFATITDSLEIIYPNTGQKPKMTEMPDIETTIGIDPGSIFNVRIADIYGVDITIKGEGLLNYNMLPNNTMSLNGDYKVISGDCKLKITGWPVKEFTILPGSSMQWDGIIENPKLNIEASTRVKGSYFNPIDNKSRAVDFFVSMQVRNKLSELEILFKVQSSDQYITSVLSAFSDDEIMRQAINLLLFETIEIPGIESSGNYLASQMNSFWESQLNSLTRSKLKNTSLSFGIDTYNQSTTAGNQERTSFTYEMEQRFMNNRAAIKISGKLNDFSEGSTYQTNSLFENFIFEYALDPANTKNIKLYQKRDYEDMLEGEVTKYGGGFLYTKSYPKLKDIWQRGKKNKNAKVPENTNQK